MHEIDGKVTVRSSEPQTALAAWMAAKGCTRARLSDLTNISGVTVGKVVGGRERVHVNTYLVIAARTGLRQAVLEEGKVRLSWDLIFHPDGKAYVSTEEDEP